MMFTPRSLYLADSSTSVGVSSRHGPHQVAQKLTMSGLPLKSASRTSRPFMSLRVKSSDALPDGLSGRTYSAHTTTAASTVTAPTHPKRRFVDIYSLLAGPHP